MTTDRRSRGTCRRAALAVLMATAPLPLRAAASVGADTAPPASDRSQQEIIINAPPLFRDIQPERVLDEDAIESYGVSTIDELLGELQVELGPDAELPLIIVNGQRLNDLSEIGALPVEALRSLEVLPRGTATRMGGTSNQRVVSIALKRQVRSATVTAGHKLASDGDWDAERGEGILTYIRGDTRANLALRTRDETALLESDRGIIQPAPFHPFSLSGNIVGYPDGAGEIDPVLSSLAGQPVTIVPVPASGTPTLAELAQAANRASATDVGRFRTLRPATRSYDFNGTFATRLAPWLTANATLRWGRNSSGSLRGLPAALIVLSPDNPFSPFTAEVAIARYGDRPLGYRSRRSDREAILTFDASWGSWQGNLNLRASQSRDQSLIERATSSATILLDDWVNPFAGELSSLITIGANRTSARSGNSLAELTLTGPAAKLPAGEVIATVEGRLGRNQLRSKSSFSTFGNGRFRRDEQSVRAALDVPLTSRDNGFLPGFGDLGASLEYSRTHFSDAGTANHQTYGLTWEPRPPLRLHGAIDTTTVPAPIQTIGNPIIVTPDVRMFDPLTGQTVDVTQISGGNPSLLPQKTTVRNVSAILKLVPQLNLQLSAEYTNTDLRNFVSSLPEASAAIMLAFPDRFVRDAEGALTTVDLRPVNFQSHREKRLRWGFSMNAKLGEAMPAAAAGARRGPSRRGTYLQLTANHMMVFSDRILVRAGLAPVDLLRGGAIGIGGGRVRHQLDATASINSGGLGARAGLTWRGPSELHSRIGGSTDTLRFSPLFLVNLQAFADVKRLVPDARWARGLRLSLDAINLTNDRQKVRDSRGLTPLQYQPAYRDALGRTIEVELRKLF